MGTASFHSLGNKRADDGLSLTVGKGSVIRNQVDILSCFALRTLLSQSQVIAIADKYPLFCPVNSYLGLRLMELNCPCFSPLSSKKLPLSQHNSPFISPQAF